MSKIEWKAGYSSAEIERAQTCFGLNFPPDLVDLLGDRRPAQGPDWNNEREIRSYLGRPFEGLLFDVEENALWWSQWGDRPEAAEDRADVLRAVLNRAPKLIPVFSHRYLPETPSLAGNPVFSVYQSDVIIYGANLSDYFLREQNGWDCVPWPKTIRKIEFWSEFLE